MSRSVVAVVRPLNTTLPLVWIKMKTGDGAATSEVEALRAELAALQAKVDKLGKMSG